jgi:hypothetical protein
MSGVSISSILIPMTPWLPLLAWLTVTDPPRIDELLDQIERIAVAEPPVLGIDTQIRTAAILQPKNPELAHRFLHDATSRAISLTDARTRAHFLNEIVDVLKKIDPAEAETLCILHPPHAEPDTLSRCYQSLFNPRKSWREEKELYRRALAAGAFTTPSLRDHLDLAAREHREELAAEFLLLLESYPGREATQPEQQQLTELAGRIRKLEPDLAAQAIELSKSAKPTKPTKPAPEKKKDDDSNKPSTDGLKPHEIVTLARKQTPLVQTEMLMDILDAKDLTTPERISIAYQAVESVNRLPADDNRLVALSMLARRLYEYGDRAKAAVAAQMLADTFAKMYNCELASCVSFTGDESPGEIIFQFAEYLAEHKIQPADIGLNHKSLEARLLLFDLEEAIEGKRRKFGFFQ